MCVRKENYKMTEEATTAAVPAEKADLIGVFPQVNGETKRPFLSCSLALSGNRIASVGVNDEYDEEGVVTTSLMKPLMDAFEEAKARGKGLLFEISNAVLAPETKKEEDGSEVHLVVSGTRYYKLQRREVGASIDIKRIGEIDRGAKAAFTL